jgi:PTH2 family peptidyl-tRNA hydrolase
MLESYNIRQTIVLRTDLKTRRGKDCSQAAHASMLSLVSQLHVDVIDDKVDIGVNIDKDSPLALWLAGSFAKITLGCKDEEELLSLYNKAKEMNIPVVLVTDNGKTEFHGVKTNTAIAIGPWYKDEIDLITKDLKLL